MFLLWFMTLITCVISYFSNGAFGLNSMSGIPLFSVGVIVALYNNRFFKCFSAAFLPLIVSFGLLSAVFAFHPRFIANTVHLLADYAAVGTILLIFSNVKPEIKISSFWAAFTFDIYLVHFKVLTVIHSLNYKMSQILFIGATVLASIAFYQVRTRLLKIS